MAKPTPADIARVLARDLHVGDIVIDPETGTPLYSVAVLTPHRGYVNLGWRQGGHFETCTALPTATFDIRRTAA